MSYPCGAIKVNFLFDKYCKGSEEISAGYVMQITIYGNYRAG